MACESTPGLNSTEELIRMNQALEHFTWSVSHDLRAPLRAVAGFLDIFREENDGKLDGRATPDEARSALDAEPADLMLMELSEASDQEIAFVRDLARTSRAMDVVPLLAVERVWSPTLARKWRLIRPLVRPYRFLDLHDVAR